MKKNKIYKNFLNKHKRDIFFKESKIQGYRSRSAFKLIEIDKKFKFIKKNLLLLDLGAAPGGWAQVVEKKIIKGKILAVDLKPMKKISNVDFIQGDFSSSLIFLIREFQVCFLQYYLCQLFLLDVEPLLS